MSITVAVNAADSPNGPQQTVGQSAQHDDCAEYNGSNGGADDDDMAVFEHEKDRHEQVNGGRMDGR